MGESMALLQQAFSSMSGESRGALLMRVGITTLFGVGLAGIGYMFWSSKGSFDVSETQGLIAGVLLITIIVLTMTMVLTALYSSALVPDLQERIRLGRD